ncbi:MAG: hypothetical protein QF440_02660 [Candidatus Thalassarchaeaceae archaeon]|jgi:hypothetical protein|nr:hypothetical protein [Candidatus Thalassarchaeaceae archaeon]
MAALDSLPSQIDAEIGKQHERITSLALFCALATISSAAWYIWPAIDGDAQLFDRLGAVSLLLIAALLLQDLAEPDARARGRLGASSSLAWPALMILGIDVVSTNGSTQLGHGFMFVVAGSCLYGSRYLLQGSLEAQRFRGIMTIGGFTIGTAILMSNLPNGSTLYLGILLLSITITSAIIDLFSGDDNRKERKRFSQTLDKLEMRILELQAQGVGLDQAASLCRNAADVGYKDPSHGFSILEEAEENIERTLALAEDISEIRDVCAATVNEASKIAPLAKKPQRSMDAGAREQDLGSLREAEQLFRRAKKLALNIIKHWENADNQIIESSKLISGLGGSQHEQLHELLRQAKEAMANEDCLLALEIAETIPEHVANLGQASDGAKVAYDEAIKIMEESEGLDLTLWDERLEQAKAHLDSGDFSLTRGIADGIIREVRKERGAMGDVQRALRQKKTIRGRWKGRDDADTWGSRLKNIEDATKRKSWSHAATLLERLTSDLDALDAASGDANELLTYVQNEWTELRKKLESRGIKAIDGERAACEKAVGAAHEGYKTGNLEECLSALGQADELMEKLRRRA